MALDLKEIKQIIDLMERSELSEFEIEKEGLKLRIHRGVNGNSFLMAPAHPSAVMPQGPVLPMPEGNPSEAMPKAALDANVQVIKSPLVGTFYSASAPENPPFVKIGSKVSVDSVVAIIEAMKVMNEIQAEVSGEVVEVLVENGQTVEYGQPLFKVKKS